jgi:hypothetical protein
MCSVWMEARGVSKASGCRARCQGVERWLEGDLSEQTMATGTAG